jgi:hypothetical protein
MLDPAADAPRAFETPIEVLPVSDAARVTDTMATVPLGIVVEFSPAMMQL